MAKTSPTRVAAPEVSNQHAEASRQEPEHEAINCLNIDCKVPAANIAVTEHAETKAEPEALPDVFRAERKTPHDLRIRCEHRRERQHEQRLARRQPSTGGYHGEDIT